LCFCGVYKENKGNDDKPPGQRYLVNYFGWSKFNNFIDVKYYLLLIIIYIFKINNSLL